MSNSHDPIREYTRKIETQYNLVKAAQVMRQSTDNVTVQQTIDSKIREAKKSISYLEDRLRELRLKQSRPTPKPENVEPNAEEGSKAPPLPPKDININRYSASFARGPYSNFDLIKYDTPHTKAQVSLMFQQLEFKLSVEKQYEEGIEKMAKLYTRENDKRSIADANSKLLESKQKIQLLKQALRRYLDLHVDVDDDDTVDESKSFVENKIRKPLSGQLNIKVHAIGDVYHASASKYSKFPESFVVVKVEDMVKARTKGSRTEQWNEECSIEIDKASEVEIIVYDKSNNQCLPVGFLWIRLSDLVDELRKKRLEQEFAGTGWLTADKVFSHAHINSSHDLSERLSTDMTPNAFVTERSLPLMRLGNNDIVQGVTAWFALEPAGKILLSLDFVREKLTRPKDLGLGRQGAIRQRKEDIHEKFGHKFVQQQFYQIMKCAFCGEFLKNAAGYQCVDCRFTCHKKCYSKVLTKCIAKSNSETDPEEAKLNHNIPHRFDYLTNIGANWCRHCGYILPLGKKNARKCTECGITCHAQCMHLVPDLCGMSMEMASQILSEIKSTQRQRELSQFEGKITKRKAVPMLNLSMDHYESDLPPPSSLKDSSYSVVQNGARLPNYDHQAEYPRSVNQSFVTEYSSDANHSNRIVPLSAPTQARDNGVELIKKPGTAPQVLVEKLKTRQKRVGLEDFNFIAVLGRGNFGKVMLAEAVATKKLYAIKVLKKDFILEHDEVESVKSEKRVFLVANKERHPFLVNLHACFQTESRIYFVMEYIRGGDLMLHIQRQQFNVKRAKFYAAEVCLALKHFHENGIIYRDLKLDNILLCPDGHIKIADYGLCKEDMWFGNTTTTFCGTPEFMAPEILLDQKYTRAVDWWAFGVFIYQILLGQSPFRGEDDEEIFQAILSDVPLYPIHMPKDSISILERLLVREPDKRLGSGPSDAKEVMAHSFFRNINWDDLLNKRVQPPFIPILSKDTDVSNFDKEFTQETPKLTPIEAKLTESMQEYFRGFSVFCGDE